MMVRAKKRRDRFASSSARISTAPGRSMNVCSCGQAACSCPCACCSSCPASGMPLPPLCTRHGVFRESVVLPAQSLMQVRSHATGAPTPAAAAPCVQVASAASLDSQEWHSAITQAPSLQFLCRSQPCYRCPCTCCLISRLSVIASSDMLYIQGWGLGAIWHAKCPKSYAKRERLSQVLRSTAAKTCRSSEGPKPAGGAATGCPCSARGWPRGCGHAGQLRPPRAAWAPGAAPAVGCWSASAAAPSPHLQRNSLP